MRRPKELIRGGPAGRVDPRGAVEGPGRGGPKEANPKRPVESDRLKGVRAEVADHRESSGKDCFEGRHPKRAEAELKRLIRSGRADGVDPRGSEQRGREEGPIRGVRSKGAKRKVLI